MQNNDAIKVLEGLLKSKDHQLVFSEREALKTAIAHLKNEKLAIMGEWNKGHQAGLSANLKSIPSVNIRLELINRGIHVAKLKDYQK